MRAVGLVANPASGKDIRRLAGKASVFDNREKLAIVRRAVIGAIAAGARRFVYMSDSHGIVKQAIAETTIPRGVRFEALPSSGTASAMDTIVAAEQMAQKDCAVVLVLGGDGTNRAFVRGWRDATLVSLSTGTNNVFPVMAEATVAGMALGLIAAGKVASRLVATQAKVIDVDIEAEEQDIALIDAVITRDAFIGAKALLDPSQLKEALLCRAEPAAVGITSLGGLVRPVSDKDDFGLHLTFTKGGRQLLAPMGPGMFAKVEIGKTRLVKFDQAVKAQGPSVIALDGERERVIAPGQRIEMRISRRGPWVVDLAATLQRAAKQKIFLRTM
ncbi:NAD(+)/NADH kinase [Pseudomonadales bacterium]|jgi:predicted polyphosphate/ATP-dependent NAD kinase|nr:ATP-NAD kinase [Gammaproteobacteria bacterium]MDA7590093.1 NAD(+)/NADH kinase [Pseudomonadales bacterium]MDA8534265.1 NAD(+)/NADH kinase [Pseudomonadales bacterium]MDC1314163.1 NAD(+)/NADH kinase [Pseudomonadales bacterium]MDC3357083.1 NAD(+)/NADH kinase [Pseudomonadales bacterium]|tara:strand:- start:1071 stop:2060 length:990 start_codon:yes stop_codon:yes gene_type:complete